MQKVYLIPAIHSHTDNAKLILGQLAEIKVSERKITIAFEVEDSPVTRAMFGVLRDSTDEQIIHLIGSSRPQLGFSSEDNDFQQEFFIGLTKMLRDGGVRIRGADAPVDKIDVIQSIDTGFNKVGVSLVYDSLDRQMEIAAQNIALLRQASDSRDPLILENVVRLVKKEEKAAVVVLFGAFHIRYLLEHLPSRLNGNQIVLQSYPDNEIEGKLEYKAVSSVTAEGEVLDKMNVARFVVGQNLLYKWRGFSTFSGYLSPPRIRLEAVAEPDQQLLEKISATEDIEELASIFEQLRSDMKKIGMRGRLFRYRNNKTNNSD